MTRACARAKEFENVLKHPSLACHCERRIVCRFPFEVQFRYLFKGQAAQIVRAGFDLIQILTLAFQELQLEQEGPPPDLFFGWIADAVYPVHRAS